MSRTAEEAEAHIAVGIVGPVPVHASKPTVVTVADDHAVVRTVGVLLPPPHCPCPSVHTA